jgi:hypothetical protein
MPPLKARVKRSAAKTPVVTKAPPMIESPSPVPVEPSAPALIPPPAPVESPSPAPAITDPDLAELRAFRTRYNTRQKTGDFGDPTVEVKRKTRDELLSNGVSLKWARFVARFGFSGEIAYAMLRTLESPSRCHAGWFKEGEIAVRRAGLDLSTLSYPAIKAVIDQWRAERKAGKSVEG